MRETREALEQKTQRAIIQHAFFRWESAAVIGLTLILAFFMPLIVEPIPAFVYLLGGLIAEIALVYSSLKDPDANRKVVEDMLQDEFHPERLQNQELQRLVQEALNYRSRIAGAITESRDNLLKEDLLQTAVQFDDWIEEMYGLAQRLDRFYQEEGLHLRNRSQAMERAGELQQKLQIEDDPAVRQEIQSSLTGIQRQIDTIEELQNAMERARLRLENTVTAMSTIYTQVTLMGAKDIDSGRSRRLREEIAEEVVELEDVLLAMDEVYAAEGGTLTS
jgi:archaellum component FlaC